MIVVHSRLSWQKPVPHILINNAMCGTSINAPCGACSFLRQKRQPAVSDLTVQAYAHVQFLCRKAAEWEGTSYWIHFTEPLPQVILRLKVVEQVAEEVVNNDVGLATLSQGVHIDGSRWNVQGNELVEHREVRVGVVEKVRVRMRVSGR